jgi:hypothetical protein
MNLLQHEACREAMKTNENSTKVRQRMQDDEAGKHQQSISASSSTLPASQPSPCFPIKVVFGSGILDNI